jgi:tetratricopeptide (TPR) repeat protein
MPMSLAKTVSWVVALGVATVSLRAQDSLQLSDGRFLIGPKMERKDDGILVRFQNGDVFVPKDLVKTSTVLPELDQRNWTDEEKDKFARGLVLFEGRWVRKEARDSELEKRREKRAEKIADASERRKWRNHYVEKTKNFEFHYTIDPDIMKGYMDMMEVYFKTFTKEWNIKKPAKIDRLKVCFYHDEDYFHQVGGAPEGVIGYYRFVPPLELNFFYDRLDQDMTTDVMFHEANHFLTHLIDLKFKYPSWVNESLAEYYGASEWDPAKKEMITGALQEGRLAVIQDAIKADEWQKLEPLIRLKHGEFNALHYAWGWSFVHYLLSNKRYENKFKSFYLALARDRDIKRVPAFYDMKEVEADEQIRALKKYLGVKELGELEKEWHDYVKNLQPASYRGYHQAGTIALARGMPIKAQRYFSTALDMGSKNPLTHYGYGRALAQKSKYDEAIEQFDKAIAMDPLNGMFYVQKAQTLRRKDKDGNKDASGRLIQLAKEIEPDNYSVLIAAAQAEFDLFGEGDDKGDGK